MAQILQRYDWTFTSKHNDQARSRNYPWDEWLDGRIRRLSPGTDFDGPAVSVERVIRTSANRRKIRVRVRIEEVEGVDTIVLQAHDDANTGRGVTRSPSKADVAARNGDSAPAKATTKRVAAKAKATAKRPSEKLRTKVPSKRAAANGAKRVSKRVSA